MKNQHGRGLVGMLMALVILIGVIGGGTGWVWNIIKIMHSDLSVITGEIILRCIGVFIAPLGAVLGYV